MAFCSFGNDGAMFGSTPVENMFIMEYMPAAPGDFVRVYLYGLMLCHHPEMTEDLSDIARALRIEKDTVINAYSYWEREGLVMKLSDNPPTYEYISTNRVGATSEPLDDVYVYRNFNQELQMALPDMILDSHEIRTANEWLDVLHLPQDVVLVMVRTEVARRGKKLPAPRTLFKHLNDVATEWATAKIDTVDKAEEYIRKSSVAGSCAAAVIRQFGLSRPATKDEIELAEKWTSEWAMSRDEILSACADTVKSANPSFAYLDKIIQSKRDGGEEDEQTHECVKTLLTHLGLFTRPTPVQMKAYKGFLEKGFDFGAIEQAAIWCGENNRHTFDDIARKLEQWQKMHVFTLAEIEEERRVQKQFTDIVLSVFERCGMDKKVTKSDISQVRIWTALVELETVLFAAECANGADAPMKYINKLVSSWSAKGIRTLEAAQQEFTRHRTEIAGQSSTAVASKEPAYAQREVTEEEFETGFYVDVMSRGKADPT